MIKNLDIQKYFSQNSSLKKFTQLSENKGTHIPLVVNDTLAYDYEECVAPLFRNEALKMVDAVYVKDNTIFFIEFKGGFVLDIRLDNFDMSRWYCKDAEKTCEQAVKIFLKNQELKISELISSINGKLLETFVTINSLILPLCDTCDGTFRTSYVAVVDEMSRPLGAMEEALNDLSEIESNTINPISNLKASVKKYRLADSNGENVFFDSIEVWNLDEFRVKIS